MTALAHRTTQPKVIARMEAERQLCEAVLAKITRKALKTVEALYAPELNEDGTPNTRRNRDADKPWNECSVKTRASLLLVKGMEAKADAGDKRVFGVVVLQGRSASAKDWEAEAKAVDDEERRKGAIDVKVDE